MERFLCYRHRAFLKIISNCPKSFSSRFSKHQALNSLDEDKRKILQTGPSLEHFIANSKPVGNLSRAVGRGHVTEDFPFLKASDLQGHGRKGIRRFIKMLFFNGTIHYVMALCTNLPNSGFLSVGI